MCFSKSTCTFICENALAGWPLVRAKRRKYTKTDGKREKESGREGREKKERGKPSDDRDYLAK